MWFAAFQSYQNNPWLVNLAAKLLSPKRTTRELVGSLLEKDPFYEPGEIDDPAVAMEAGMEGEGDWVAAPKFVKAELYLYE